MLCSRDAYATRVGGKATKISPSPPNKNAEKDTRNCASSAFLLLFRGVFALLMHEKPILRLKSLSSEIICTFGVVALFLFVKFEGIR